MEVSLGLKSSGGACDLGIDGVLVHQSQAKARFKGRLVWNNKEADDSWS